MKKQALILFAFMILVELISTHSITKISNANCDPSGKETFDLEVTPEGDITQLTEFKVTLKKEDEKLTASASCILEELSSDMLKVSDTDSNIEDSADNASDFESEKKENEKGEKKENESGKKEGESGEGESGKEGEGDKKEGESGKEKESGDKKEGESGKKGEGEGERRRLQEKVIPITFVCTLDSLIKPGSYSLEKPDKEALKITTTDPIELPPCSSDMISSDEGSDLEVKSEELIDDLKRAEIKLSFRQVLDFDKTKFNFIGLTTEKIEAKTEIIFMIYLKLGKEKQSKPVDVKCVNNLAAEVSDKNPIAIVSFECSIPVEYEYQKDFDSIEIASSEFVAGLPVDETLLNPVLTDAEIKEDPSKNKTTMEPPTLADFKGEITNEMIKEGKFEFSIELGLEKPELQGSTFKMPLVFPEGIVLEFTILEVKGTKVSFSVEIIGEVNEQPLVLEQTIIIINGEEAFILPGIVTEKITTEGVKEDSNNILTSDEEGKSSDNELSSDKDSSDNAGEEGKSDEEKGESDELSSDESTDEEGKSSDNVTSSDESGESSDKAGSSDEESTTTGQISKGNSDEPTPEELKEDALERAEIFITFRQISGFAFVPGTVSFNFFALITQSLDMPYQIKLFVNLITVEGMDDQPTEIECSLDSSETSIFQM